MFSRVKLWPSECHTGDTSSENTPERSVLRLLRCSPPVAFQAPLNASLSTTPSQHSYHKSSLPSKMVPFQVFVFTPICWCSAAGLYTNCVYATNIFLQFECLIQPFICCQQNIKACRVLEADKTVWKDENYNYCHRCPTKTALRCFSSPCLSPNVTTYRVKMESRGHCWSSLTTSCILSYV